MEIFARLMAFLLCFLASPSSLIYKRTWYPDPGKMVILRHKSAILAGFPNKVIFLASVSHLSDSLAFCGEQSKSLDLATCPLCQLAWYCERKLWGQRPSCDRNLSSGPGVSRRQGAEEKQVKFETGLWINIVMVGQPGHGQITPIFLDFVIFVVFVSF